MSAFGNILNYIFVFFDWIIYELASLCYVLFATMCEMDASLIGEGFQGLMGRIQVFLGVIMLFIVAFNLLKMLVDPSTIESATSSMIKKVAITVVLLVCSTFIFETLDKFQKDIIGQARIERIITGSDLSSADTGLKKYVSTGKYFSYTLFFSFINVEEDLRKEIMGAENGKTLWDVVGAINDTNTTYRYPIISGAVGILLAVMFIAFALDIGIRAFTLIILQVISPIPIIMYITPKGDGMLSKYLKTYMGVYIQLFVKIALAYVMLYLMQICMASILETADKQGAIPSLFPNLGDGTTGIFRVLLFVIVMVAIFMFVQKLPKMLSEIFGIDFAGGAIDPFKITGNILKTGGALTLGAGGMALGAGVGALGTIGTGASLKEVGKAALGGAGRGAQAGYGLRNARNVSDVISRGYTATRDNFRTSRTNTQSLLDRGGVDGVRATRANTENERTIKEAEANLGVINQGEEIRKAVDSGVEDYVFKNDNNLKAFGNRDNFIQARTATSTAKIKQLTEKAANLPETGTASQGERTRLEEAIANEYATLNAIKLDAEKEIKTAIDSNRASAIAVEGSKAQTESVKLENHFVSNSQIYGDKRTTAEVKEIKNKQQQIINKASSNEAAIAAGQAQARGAAHAASRSNTNK